MTSVGVVVVLPCEWSDESWAAVTDLIAATGPQHAELWS
jgi:hypothetical protein